MPQLVEPEPVPPETIRGRRATTGAWLLLPVLFFFAALAFLRALG